MSNNRKRISAAPRKMKPVFLIFCEGQTEEAYINMLQRHYHSPIKIITTVQGQHISQRLINNYQSNMKIGTNDTITTFLMYDLDVAEVLPRLQSCEAQLLLSNPTIEFWFLLHSKQHQSSLTAVNATSLLQKAAPEWKDYTKGNLTQAQIQTLWNNRIIATQRAKALKDLSNPSSGIYLLIEKLENAQQHTNPKP